MKKITSGWRQTKNTANLFVRREMQVKDAVRTAIDNVQDLFQAEDITNLGLEEVNFDEASDEWIVTVGFSRPWDYPRTSTFTSAISPQTGEPRRSFKIVRVHDSTGRVTSVSNYQNRNVAVGS